MQYAAWHGELVMGRRSMVSGSGDGGRCLGLARRHLGLTVMATGGGLAGCDSDGGSKWMKALQVEREMMPVHGNRL